MEFLESYHIQRWSVDPYSRGSWSQILVGGSPLDRKSLSEPISPHLILAGEACHEIQPAMIHGAFESGVRAAQWVLSRLNDWTDTIHPKVIIIGAGAAGIGACRELMNHKCQDVTILEARNRIGGRVFTVPLEGLDSHSNTIFVDAGGTWLQQSSENILVNILKKAQRESDLKDSNQIQSPTFPSSLSLLPSDWNFPLTPDPSLSRQVQSYLEDMEEILQGEVDRDRGGGRDIDLSVEEALTRHYFPPSPTPSPSPSISPVVLGCVLSEVLADSGLPLSRLSARFGLSEPGLGADDLCLGGGGGRGGGLQQLLQWIVEGESLGQRGEGEGEGGEGGGRAPMKVLMEREVREVHWGARDSSSSPSSSPLYPINLKVKTRKGEGGEGEEGGGEGWVEEEVGCDYCICTLPISLLHTPPSTPPSTPPLPPSPLSSSLSPFTGILFDPPLPPSHSLPLSRLRMGLCDKIVLRFRKRFWPKYSIRLRRGGERGREGNVWEKGVEQRGGWAMKERGEKGERGERGDEENEDGDGWEEWEGGGVMKWWGPASSPSSLFPSSLPLCYSEWFEVPQMKRKRKEGEERGEEGCVLMGGEEGGEEGCVLMGFCSGLESISLLIDTYMEGEEGERRGEMRVVERAVLDLLLYLHSLPPFPSPTPLPPLPPLPPPPASPSPSIH